MSGSVAEWVLARAAAAVPGDVVIFDGEPTGLTPDRYVSLYIGEGLRSASGVDGLSRDLDNSFQATSVCTRPNSTGSVSPMTRWLAKRVRDGFVDQRPVVDGLLCGPIEHTLSNPPVTDQDVKDKTAVYAVDQFRVMADVL